MSYDSKQYGDFSCCFIPVRHDLDLWDRQIHSHATEELLLIISKGNCTIDSNGSTYQVETPAFIWNRAGSYHRIIHTPEDPRTSYLVAFAPDILSDIPAQLQYMDFMRGYGLFALTLNNDRLFRMRALFNVLINSPLRQRQLMFPCIFHQISLYLKAGSEPVVSYSRFAYITQVLALLGDPNTEKLTSQQVATRFHVSRNKLESDFKRATGQTLYSFRLQRQLQNSRLLLANTNKSLVEIANACGFTDESHLIRAFRKQYDMTPGVFRKQHKQNPRWLK